MRASRRALTLGALAVLLAAGPLRAEIRTEVRDGEIVATNMRTTRRPPPSLSGAPAAARAGIAGDAGGIVPADVSGILRGSAARYAFDPALIEAVVAAESAFDNLAVSKKGARGLMQLMPETAREYGVRDVHDPATNVEAGVAYLRELVSRFQGDVALALAAYNAGPEAVARYGGVPPYDETRRHLERIRGYYGADLDAGDWSSYPGGIRLARIEEGGVPHFTNIRPRRVVKASPRGEPPVGPGP